MHISIKKVTTNQFKEKFTDTIKNSNFFVIRCTNLVFSSRIKTNIGFYTLMFLVLFQIADYVYHMIIALDPLYIVIYGIMEKKFVNESANPPLSNNSTNNAVCINKETKTINLYSISYSDKQLIESNKEGNSIHIYKTSIKEKIIFVLTCVPNGVTEMSADIPGLVQTSLNLGILKTENGALTLSFGLRSNKKSGLSFLEEKVAAFFNSINWDSVVSGHYPPWEYKEDSRLRELYKEVYTEYFGKAPKVEAIHAGLECGVFSDAIDGIDCISVGPALYDVHTVNEKLSISSTENVFNILLKILPIPLESAELSLTAQLMIAL